MQTHQDAIFLFAGEPSGDLHGSSLIKALRELNTNLKFIGVGGPLMRSQGLETIMEMESFAVMGFTDVFLSLPRLIKQFYFVRAAILKSNPKGVVLIDYPGFNLKLATHLRKKGYQGKIIQYISPTVWAHGKKRIQTMEKSLDHLLTIYPFEKKYFENSSLKVTYVGHPLTETIEGQKSEQCSINKDLVALFPGSREAEIRRNLKKMLGALTLLKKQEPHLHLAISVANEKVKPLIEELIDLSDLPQDDFSFIPPSKTYELMKSCNTAVAKSGTVTLELALYEKPTVVVYQLSFFNWLFAKFILRLKLPFYSIVNIITGKETFTELIERGFTTKNLFTTLRELHQEGKKRESCLIGCKEVRALLKEEHPTKKAAETILEVIHR